MARCFFVVQVEPGRVLRLQLKANRPLRTLLRNDEIRDACSRGGVVCWRSTGEAVPLNETGVQQQLPSAEKHRPGLSVHLVITQPGTVSDAQSASSASSEPPEGLDAAGSAPAGCELTCRGRGHGRGGGGGYRGGGGARAGRCCPRQAAGAAWAASSAPSHPHRWRFFARRGGWRK
eukprot:TRINITY_DN13535_c0_g1_i4.p2 TRINITY_DN13535_c0_g1~~TRINITY_DN13535_c0_g1_i4.p2  ORF type:complete len:193 (+),score=13.10 TRINITY_DN13535_c0_g1_i4:54-581(+)